MMEYRPKNGLDIWLNEKGFYRKHVAMDETCLFRAVSDQVHNTQIYHEDIRKQCIDFAKENRNQFKDLLNDSEWEDHLYNLQKHFIVCGDIEIQILSKMLKRDFMIIDSNDYKTENVTNNGYNRIISLCKMKDGHYDSVWAKEHIENSGFCQALIYKLVYEDVFDFDDVDEIVKKMLYNDDSEARDNLNLFDMFLPAEIENHVEDDITKNPPFPYKVAKALDPNQYRNVEFDAWNQTRKDIRLKDWYMGGDDLKVGTKCLLIVENNSFDCYIQDINYEGRENVCLVYVVEWAEKVVVQREELMALPDAKPWPLPYTMSRNIKEESSVEVVVETAVEVSESRTLNYNNKRRGNRRRRGQNNNRNNCVRSDNNNKENEVSPLEGCPLLTLPFSPFVDENANNPNKEDINNNQNSLVPYESNSLVPYEGNTSVPYEDNNLVPYDSNCLMPYEDNNAVPFEMSYNSNNQNGNSMASDNDWNSWLSSPSPPTYHAPSPYPAPFPQVCVAAQCNTIIQENDDSKVTTVYSKFIKKTYKDNIQTANYPAAPYAVQPVPVYNYSQYQPQYCTGSCCTPQYQPQSYSNYPEYQPQTMSNYSEYQPTQMVPVASCPYDPQYLLGVPYPDYGASGIMAPPPTPETSSTPVSPVMPVPFYPQPVPIGNVVYPCHYVPCYGYWIHNQMAVPQQNLPQTMYPQLNVPLQQDVSSSEDFDLKLEGEPVESPPYFKPENPEWPPETVFQYGTSYTGY